MNEYRQINRHIRKDGWFVELPSTDKLLYLYLLSNGLSTLSGRYDIPLRVIEFETGLDRETIAAALGRFDRDHRATYALGRIHLFWMPHPRNHPFIDILERDYFTCRYCGDPNATHVDHIIPKCQGGTDDPDNLVSACEHCNCSKGGRTPEEAGMRLINA